VRPDQYPLYPSKPTWIDDVDKSALCHADARGNHHCKVMPLVTAANRSNGAREIEARAPIREAAFASLKEPLRPVRVPVDPTDDSEEREASGR
jgi:hypothetical protein